ncbi:hypothetical protein WA171_000172, partial [Blastocystis sp. BT1]
MPRLSLEERQKRNDTLSTIKEARIQSVEDKKVSYLLSLSEKLFAVNPELAQQYLIKAQCLCRERKINFPPSFPYLFCPHCSCIMNKSNTSSFRIVAKKCRHRAKYTNLIERVCRLCGTQVRLGFTKPGSIRIKKTAPPVKQESGKKVKPSHNIKKQASLLLSTNLNRKPVKMRSDW